MNPRVGAGAAILTVLAVAMTAPLAGARPVVAHATTPTITQTYGCSTPVGDVDLTGTVTGKAKIKNGKISLSKVVYSVTNSVGLDLVVDSVKISTSDPGKRDAPYVKGSVKVAKKPKGWKAGHDKSGVFASFPRSKTIRSGDAVTSAALKAKYKVKGEPGTVVDFHPGDVSFHVTSPLEGDVSCTPSDPVGTFASVTE